MTRRIILRSFQLQLSLIAGVLCFLSTSLTVAQQNETLVGFWTLEKVAYKKLKVETVSNPENLVALFKASLYNQLSAEQRLDFYELEQVNEKAAGLLELLFQSDIEFQANRAFYNRSKISEHITSGEYLLDGKKLYLEWETAEKNTFKILSLNASQLVLKDVNLNTIYYYTKTKILKL